MIDHQQNQRKDFHKDSLCLERDNRNPYHMFLALGKVLQIVSQTYSYYNASFIPRIIR